MPGVKCCCFLFCVNQVWGFVDEVFCGGDDDGESVDGFFYSCLFCFDYRVLDKQVFELQ